MSTVIALDGLWQAALTTSIVTVLIAATRLTNVVLGFVERRRVADQRHMENVLRLRLEAARNRHEQNIHVALARHNVALQAAVIQKIAADSPMADAPAAILAVRAECTLDPPPL